MRLLQQTNVYREDTEADAIAAIQKFRDEADEKGYIVSKASYAYKTKKSKGEIIDEGFLVSLTADYATFWDEV